MSMHIKPLTPIEEAGLRAHGLPVGKPSQLADAFRLGMAWADKAHAEAALAEPGPDADSWIPWAGDYCQPRRMSPDTLVSVKLRCGYVITQNCGTLNWEQDDDPGDIIAYRVAKP